jgi:hypothetical protein
LKERITSEKPPKYFSYMGEISLNLALVYFLSDFFHTLIHLT